MNSQLYYRIALERHADFVRRAERHRLVRSGRPDDPVASGRRWVVRLFAARPFAAAPEPAPRSR